MDMDAPDEPPELHLPWDGEVLTLSWHPESLTPVAFIGMHKVTVGRSVALRPTMERGWQETWVSVILLTLAQRVKQPTPPKSEPLSPYGLYGHQDEELL